MRRRIVSAILIGLVSVAGAIAQEDEPVVEATSLSGKALYRPTLPEEDLRRLEANAAKAKADYLRSPGDVELLIWYGRRVAYLWHYQDAVEVYSKGIEQFPRDARLYRHRGHRWITLRKLDLAIDDLRKAADLIGGTEDEIEPDGAPNAAGIPTSTLHTNIWYHLGLAYYLQGDFESALPCYEKCLAAATNNDMRVATLDWMYMTLRRLGRHDQADQVIQDIDEDTEIIENFSYHRRILMYRGKLKPEELLPSADDERSSLDLATQGYGVANWYFVEGEEEKARELWRQVTAGDYWAAFGFIAAEADLAREGK